MREHPGSHLSAHQSADGLENVLFFFSFTRILLLGFKHDSVASHVNMIIKGLAEGAFKDLPGPAFYGVVYLKFTYLVGGPYSLPYIRKVIKSLLCNTYDQVIYGVMFSLSIDRCIKQTRVP